MNNAAIWEVVEDLETGGKSRVDSTISRLSELGGVPGIYVGLPEDKFTEDMAVEWYVGQGMSILIDKQYFAVNSWINNLTRFVPLGPVNYGT
jgi:hypothetical protein